MAPTIGPMVETMRDSGSTIKCKAKDFSNGLTDVSIRVNMPMIRRRGSASLTGKTDDGMKDNGRTVNSTVKARICRRKVKRRGVSGKTAKESNG